MAMTASGQAATGKGRIAVDLDELIALRQRVAHAPLRQDMRAMIHVGQHATRRRGRGMDYLESRAYQAGDDVRHLDWRLTARSGSLHTKVFQEEGEHRVMLLIDTHASMRFGTREQFKSVQAARAAALMAWQVTCSGGQVGALAFGASRHIQVAASGRRGALGACAALARWDATPGDGHSEKLASALQRMRPLLVHASHAVLVSDGHHCDDATASLLAHWRRAMRVSVLVVTDPLESERPPAGRYAFSCDGRRVVANLDSLRARDDFRQAMAAPARRLEQACRTAAIPCHGIDTREDPLPVVTALLGLARRRT